MTKGEETRLAILDRAVEIASVTGIEGLTIGALAQDLKMSKSGLFAHFGAKTELQLAVLRHAVDRIVSHVIVPAIKQPRGEPRLRALFDGWIEWDRDGLPGGCPVHAAVTAYEDVDGPIRDFLVASQRDWFDTLTQVTRVAIQAGALRSDVDPRIFSFELANILAGYRRHARLFREADAESLARAAFDALLERSAPLN